MCSKKLTEVSSEDVLDKILAQYYTQFQLEYKRADTLLTMRRIYDTGQTLELAFKHFFLSILPEYVGITRGVIFDTNGNKHSNEIDLIFYDKRYFPGFIVKENGDDQLSYISVDTVLGIASVKKTFDFKTWIDSIENLNSVYSLEKNKKEHQMHYDVSLGDGLNFDKAPTDKIFSCILSSKCEFAHQKDKNMDEDVFLDIQTLSDVILKKSTSLKESDIDKYKLLFTQMPVDLIYTLDGILAYSLEYNKTTNLYNKILGTKNLGCGKKFIQYIDQHDSSSIAYGFDYRLDRYSSALGLVVVYVYYWCSNLIKCSPKMFMILDKYLKSSFV
jgi:hypothetical protein